MSVRGSGAGATASEAIAIASNSRLGSCGTTSPLRANPHKLDASPHLTSSNFLSPSSFVHKVMSVEHFSQKPVYCRTSKQDSTVMATEKASANSSPPVTHTEHLAVNENHPSYRHSTVDGEQAYGEHGPLVDHKVPQEDVVRSEPDLRWSRIRHYLREPFSEFWVSLSVCSCQNASVDSSNRASSFSSCLATEL